MRCSLVLLPLLFFELSISAGISFLLLGELFVKVFDVLELLFCVVHTLHDFSGATQPKVLDVDCASARRSLKQELLELLVFRLELADNLVGGALVNNSFVLNFLRSISVPES